MGIFSKRKDYLSLWQERWKYFKPHEVLGKAGNKLWLDRGELMIDETALSKLCEFRLAIGEPILVSSGYRTPDENYRVGGASNSYHVLGKAFDIRCPNISLDALYYEAKQFGWHGIGRYDTFLHVDNRTILDGRVREWDYRKHK
jgi:uncharacterized protein YcbK (DUF882 family)